MSDVYIDYDNAESKGHYVTEALLSERKKNLDKLLKEKSLAYAPGLEQMESVPNPNISDRRLRKQRKVNINNTVLHCNQGEV